MTIPRLNAAVIAALIVLGLAGPAWGGPEDRRNRPQWGLVLIRGMDGWVACGIASGRNVRTPHFAIIGPVPYEIVGYVPGGIQAGVQAIDHKVKRIGPYRVYHPSGVARLPIEEVSFLSPRPRKSGLADGPMAVKVVANVLDDEGRIVRDEVLNAKITPAGKNPDGRMRYRIDIPYRPGLVGAVVCDSTGGRIADLTHDPDAGDSGQLVVTSLISGLGQLKYRSRIQPNPTRARALADKAGRLFAKAAVDKSVRTLHEAQLYLRHALVADRKNVPILQQAGQAYVRLGRPDVAIHYFNNVIELDPNAHLAHAHLGLIHLGNGHLDEATAGFQQALKAPVDSAAAALAAEGFSRLLAEQANWAAAAYACAWSAHARKKHPTPSHTLSDLKGLLAKAHPAEAKQVEARMADGRFTRLELNGLARPTTNDARDVNGRSFDMGSYIRSVTDGAPVITGTALKKRLPGTVIDTHLAGFGCYVLMRFEKLPKIGIFDLAHARFAGFIDDVGSDALVAVGGRQALVYRPGANSFSVYDVGSGRQIRQGPCRMPTPPTSLAMGELREDIALALQPIGQGASTALPRVVELKDFKLRPAPPLTRDRKGLISTGRQLQTDGLGRHLVVGNDRYCLQGQDLVHLASARFWAIKKNTLSISSDGRWVCSAHGILRGLRLKATYDCHGMADRSYPMAAVGWGDFFFEIAPGGSHLPPRRIELRAVNGRCYVKTFEVPIRLEYKADRLVASKALVASATIDRLAVIDNAARYVYVHRLGLSDGASLIGLVAIRGQSWQCKLPYAPGGKVSLASAPAGASLDAATKTLSWAVPLSAVPGHFEFLLNVIDPDEKESYRRLYVRVR